MKNNCGQKGVALILVLVALTIVLTTVVTIMAVTNSHSNSSAALTYSKVALSRAEDGLEIGKVLMAKSILKDGDTKTIETQYKGNKWSITITLNGSQMTSEAILKDYLNEVKYRRKIQVALSGFLPTNAMLATGGNLDVTGGTSNINGAGDFYVGGTAEWSGGKTNGVAVQEHNGGDALSSSEISKDQTNAGNDVHVNQTYDPVQKKWVNNNPPPEQPIPDIDWNLLKTTNPDIKTLSQLALNPATKDMCDYLKNLAANGGTLVIKVTGPVTIDVNTFKYFNAQKPVNIIFERTNPDTDTYPFSVTFNGNGGLNVGGATSIYVRGGPIKFINLANFSCPGGTVYTDYNVPGEYSVDVSSATNFKVKSLVTKGSVRLNCDFNPVSDADKTGDIEKYTKKKMTNWREL